LTTPSQEQVTPPPQKVFVPVVTGIGIVPMVLKGGESSQHIVVLVEDASDIELELIYNQVNVQVAGFSVTVLRAGRVVGQASPVIGGSICTYAPLHYNVPQVTAGTLGAVAKDNAGKHHILGSNHVMAYNGRAPEGTPIVAPGTL
jgi:hypothetical protein